MASRREEWAQRVAAWQRSGQTAKSYARSIGVNAGTLTHWAWRLCRPQPAQPSPQRRQRAPKPAMIEVVRTAGIVPDGFELQLASGHRVRVPEGFDAAALRRLIAVLEGQA